jgi:hypothetical protein
MAGASGLLGVRPFPLLVGTGYDVAGMARTPANVGRLRFVPEWRGSEAA